MASTRSSFSRGSNSLRRDRLNLGRFVVAVLDDPHAGRNPAAGQHLAGDALQDLREAEIGDRPMVNLGPGMFAQANEHHLHQAALDVAHKVGVRLDAAHHHYVVGLVGKTVEVDGNPLRRFANNDRLHRGANGAAQKRLGHAVAFHDRPLAFRRAATMAAHGRDNERFGPQRFEVIDDTLDDDVDVGYAAAAGRDRHIAVGLDLLGKIEPTQLGLDRGGDIVHALGLKLLPHAKHLGIVGHYRGFSWAALAAIRRPT